MTTINRKHQILESLDSLDQAQTEKVLAYIQGLTYSTKEDAGYQKLKREAMKEIRQALSRTPTEGKSRKLNPAF